jgi:hypothetical protein
LKVNLLTIEQPWTIKLPIGTVFTNLESIAFSIACKNTITNSTSIHTGYSITG